MIRARLQHVERFSQEPGKIIVSGVHDDPVATAPLSPESAGQIGFLRAMINRSANGQSELEAKSPQRQPAVFSLGAPLRCLGARSGRPVSERHRGFDLVPVLAPRSRASRRAELALAGEHLGIQRGGMTGLVRCIAVLLGTVHRAPDHIETPSAIASHRSGIRSRAGRRLQLNKRRSCTGRSCGVPLLLASGQAVNLGPGIEWSSPMASRSTRLHVGKLFPARSLTDAPAQIAARSNRRCSAWLGRAGSGWRSRR